MQIVAGNVGHVAASVLIGVRCIRDEIPSARLLGAMFTGLTATRIFYAISRLVADILVATLNRIPSVGPFYQILALILRAYDTTKDVLHNVHDQEGNDAELQ